MNPFHDLRTTLLWPDLPNVHALIGPVGGEMNQATIFADGDEAIHALLLPDGLFSPFSSSPCNGCWSEACIAFGRVITWHSGCASKPARALPSVSAWEHEAWPDLATRHSWAAFGDIRAHHLRHDTGETVFVVMRADPTMPVACAQFSRPDPGREVLLAFGRAVLTGDPRP
jgi:hypothetical protein